MSRLGKKPVAIPPQVTVSVKGSSVCVQGPKGTLTLSILPGITVTVDGSLVRVASEDAVPGGSARHGLTRMLLQNMTIGVSQGYEKKLEIIGVGYKAQLKPLDTAQGKVQNLMLNLGHSHPITLAIPAGLEVTQDEKNKNLLTIRGISKELVGQCAADIRSLRPPEPYKGKGVRYVGELVRRKPGKAAVAKAA